MKKSLAILILATLGMMSFFLLACGKTSKVEAFAVSFVENCFSDGALQYEDYLSMISDDSQALKDLVAYKKEIKAHSGIKDLYLYKFKVNKVKIKTLADGHYDVFVETMEDNARPGSEPEQSRQNYYRIVVQKDGDQLKVLKAISDDFTSSTFFPGLMSNLEAFLAYDMASFDQDIKAIAIAEEVAQTQTYTAEAERAQADYLANKEAIGLQQEEEERRLVAEKNEEVQDRAIKEEEGGRK